METIQRFAPLGVGLILAASTVAAWRLQQGQEDRLVLDLANSRVEGVRDDLEGHLRDRTQGLVRMAHRLESQPGTTRADWTSDAELFMDHLPGLHAVARVGPDGQFEWVAPAGRAEAFRQLDRGSQPIREARSESRRSGRPVATRSIDFAGRATGFLVFVPVEPEGWIAGTYLPDGLFPALLADERDALRSLSIHDGDTLVYRMGQPEESPWGARSRLRFVQREWRIHLTLRPEEVAARRSILPLGMLAGGLLVSGLFAASLALGLSARSAADALRRANARLETEALERSKVERALRAAREALERTVDERTEALRREANERRSAEERFLQAQKLEAVGRLAGGIAHDFNNILVGILGYSDLVLREIPPATPWRSMVESIQGAAMRAAELVRDILAFSRKQVTRPVPVELEAILRSMLRMLRPMVGETIEIEIDVSPDVGFVRVDPGQLEQVIANLAVNARDAMPRGGSLRLTASRIVVGRESASGLEPGVYAAIEVRDTGTGMPPEVRARAFEPFFTTKDVGRGSGLGLSTCYGLMKQNGGHIEIDSEPGRGTTIRLLLPHVSGSPGALDPPVSMDQTAPVGARGRETVLLAEDEELVRNVARHILSAAGYEVLQAADGVEALEIARHVEGTIDLLLTDVVMPNLGGFDLAMKLRDERPDLPVLFTSGYAEEVLELRGRFGAG